MPSTGYTFPGTGANDSTDGSIAWTNPSNILSDNASYATALNVTPTTTQYLLATNFGFAIPTGAVISGVQVKIECHYTVDSDLPSIRDWARQLIVGGSRTGNFKTGAVWTETTPTTIVTGGENDLWGCTLTPAIVNASNFGVSMRAQNIFSPGQADLFVDYVQINVHYGLGRSQIRIID